jgi:hypothetical protein
MDEHSGIIHDPVVDALKGALAKAVVKHGSRFRRSFCR